MSVLKQEKNSKVNELDRVLEGIGVAAYTTAMYSIICHWFPKEFGFVFATVQVTEKIMPLV